MNIMNDPKTVIIYPTELIVGAISDVFLMVKTLIKVRHIKLNSLSAELKILIILLLREITKIFNNAFDTFQDLCYPSKNHFINEEIAIFINDTYKRHKLIVNNTIDGLHIGDINPGGAYTTGDEIIIKENGGIAPGKAKITVKSIVNKGIIKSVNLNPSGNNFKVGDIIFIKQNNNQSAYIRVTEISGGNVKSITIRK